MFFVNSDTARVKWNTALVALFEIQIQNDASLVGAAWLYECYECSPTYPPITRVCVCVYVW